LRHFKHHNNTSVPQLNDAHNCLAQPKLAYQKHPHRLAIITRHKTIQASQHVCIPHTFDAAVQQGTVMNAPTAVQLLHGHLAALLHCHVTECPGNHTGEVVCNERHKCNPHCLPPADTCGQLQPVIWQTWPLSCPPPAPPTPSCERARIVDVGFTVDRRQLLAVVNMKPSCMQTTPSAGGWVEQVWQVRGAEQRAVSCPNNLDGNYRNREVDQQQRWTSMGWLTRGVLIGKEEAARSG
jgi:hypothetical protein